MSDLGELRFGDVLTFLTVYRCGAITGAARALRVTPSQVSKAVQRLEAQLGVTLLSRSPRGVVVSDAGRRLIPRLEDLTARLRQLRPESSELEQLALAAPSYLNVLYLPRIASWLPELRVLGVELPPALVRAYAVENLFDLALLLGDERLGSGWSTTIVGEVRKALFATPEVARRLGPPPVEAVRLADRPFIGPVYQVDGQFVPADDGCPLPHGERRLGHQSQTLVAALELARHTGQLVFGPAIAASAHVARGELVEVPVRGWEVRDPLVLCCNEERVRARVARLLTEKLRASLTELDPAQVRARA